ncbi:hypothetical protein [Belnapia mucosa]|uniref:hypothetical protein n=1 Tax=Belnapia mucosa TaxID=2804532 RepID=UPI001F1711D8|nr:hypothetical protein [Belnapia mucosa]
MVDLTDQEVAVADVLLPLGEGVAQCGLGALAPLDFLLQPRVDFLEASRPDVHAPLRSLLGLAQFLRACDPIADVEEGGEVLRHPILLDDVLASAGIITGTVALAWVAGTLGLGGAALSAITFAGLL